MTGLEKDTVVIWMAIVLSDSSRIHCFNNHCINNYGPGRSFHNLRLVIRPRMEAGQLSVKN